MESDAEMAAAGAQADAGPYAWYVVGILVLAYTFSFIDRQILTLMVDPIRETLQISDTQLSLLHGFAFAIFYSIMGIPIGRLVDSRRRTTIIAAGVAVWSIMTAVCGLARNFTQLFVARIGVGIGEAALSPGAYSMISDYFPPHQRPRALSLYISAAYVGAGIAIIAGGALIGIMPPLDLPIVGHLEPWQGLFLVVGLPGLLVALIVLTLREPLRTGVKPGLPPSFAEVLRFIGQRKRAFGLLIVGFALSGVVWNGTIAWIPTYFIRVFGWTASEIALPYGLITIVSGMGGIMLGGTLATRLRTKGVLDANLLIGLLALAIAMPAGIAATMVGSAQFSLGLFTIFLFGCAMPWGSAAAAIQEITPNQMRGQLSAIYLFFLSLVGMGVGPTFVAIFTDHLFADDMALGNSIALSIAVAAPLSAVLLWLARKPYREALKEANF